MKNIKYILTGTLALSLFVSSCKKDFLDEKPSQQISTDQLADAVKQDPTLLKGMVSGLYSTMYNTFTGGTTGHDDFGQKGIDIYTDMLVSDMMLGAQTYGWYVSVSRYQATTDFTLNPAYVPWRYYFRQIFAANTVIDVLGGNDAEITDATLKNYMAQAKAIRAYAYFYLAQLYAPEGYGSGAEKILPIYTDTKVPNQALSTSAQVYDLMVKDLTYAVETLKTYNRENKGEINADVAKGLLAYVYSSRGTADDLAKVITLTNEVMSVYPLTTKNAVVAQLDASGKLINSVAGFNNVSTPSWIWGTDLTIASDLDLVSWWGQVDVYTYSYASVGDAKVADPNLVAAIRPDDVRKGQFVNSTKYKGLIPTGKFFDPARVEQGQRTVTTDYLYMRADEMSLLNAEAKFRTSQEDAAKTELKRLLSLRATDVSYIDALSGNALKEEIYLQSRIELWGEGKTYLAMKRNKHSITRAATNLFFPGQTFTYNSDELTFPIPQAEVINNPNLNK
jgi:hypothetical protein